MASPYPGRRPRRRWGFRVEWRIELRPAAMRDMKRLDPKALRKVARAIEGLGKRPHGAGTRKLRGAKDLHRARAGDWRIVYRADPTKQVIVVVRVRHRREVYRGL